MSIYIFFPCKSERRWSVKTFFVIFGFCATLAAQQPTGGDPGLLLRADAQRRAEWATEWLRSEDQRRIAWGAWVARQDHQKALTSLLIDKVRKYIPTGETSSQSVERDRHDAMLAVLDALIGLNAEVPVNEARKLYPEFAAQSLILLLRSGDDVQSALLDIFQNAKANCDWLTAGNVLEKNRTPGFAWALMSRFTQHVTVTVADPNVGIPGGGGSFVAFGCGFSHKAPKADWPAVGLYLLTKSPDLTPRLTGTFLLPGDTTATFLVPGDATVYYFRAEPGNYDDPYSGGCDNRGRDEYRAQYVNKLVALPGLSLSPYPQETIVWHDSGLYTQQLVAFVKEQEARFRELVASLQQSRVLTSAEAAKLEFRFEIVVRDVRSNPSLPLPALSIDDVPIPIRTTFSPQLD